MEVAYREISNTEKELTVELSFAEFEKYCDRAALDLSKDLEISGFRKGHVPRKIVEDAVGSNKVYSLGADIAVQSTILGGIKEAGLEADKFLQGVPEVQVMKVAQGNPFVYKAIFAIPFFVLAEDYKEKALQARKSEEKNALNMTNVEENEVTSALAWLAQNRKAKDINDEFAKSVGGFTNLEELKSSIRDGLRIEKEKSKKDRLRIAMLKEIIQYSKHEVPQKCVEREVLRMEEELSGDISRLGLDLDTYLAKINKKKEDLRKNWNEAARERIEFSLALNAVAEQEHISPSDEEVAMESQKALQHFSNAKEAEEKIHPARLREYIQETLRREKVFEFLENL